jgi:hypothetical protein
MWVVKKKKPKKIIGISIGPQMGSNYLVLKELFS